MLKLIQGKPKEYRLDGPLKLRFGHIARTEEALFTRVEQLGSTRQLMALPNACALIGSRAPEKIALADFHAALAQQGVDHAGMKVKIRQHEIVEVADGREFPRAIGKLDFDGAAFIAGNFCGLTVFR